MYSAARSRTASAVPGSARSGFARSFGGGSGSAPAAGAASNSSFAGSADSRAETSFEEAPASRSVVYARSGAYDEDSMNDGFGSDSAAAAAGASGTGADMYEEDQDYADNADLNALEEPEGLATSAEEFQAAVADIVQTGLTGAQFLDAQIQAFENRIRRVDHELKRSRRGIASGLRLTGDSALAPDPATGADRGRVLGSERELRGLRETLYWARNTWRLLQLLQQEQDERQRLQARRAAMPAGQWAETQRRLTARARFSHRQLLDKLALEHPDLTRDRCVVDWLEELAQERLATGEGQQAQMLRGEVSLIRTRRLMATSAAGEAGANARDRLDAASLDPDGPGRAGGPEVAPGDREEERRLLARLWAYLRAGQLDQAAELCRRWEQAWRVPGLLGGDLWEVVPDGRGGYQELGNPRRLLWKQACAQLATAPWQGTNPDAAELLERAIYGALANRLEPVLALYDSKSAAHTSAGVSGDAVSDDNGNSNNSSGEANNEDRLRGSWEDECWARFSCAVGRREDELFAGALRERGELHLLAGTPFAASTAASTASIGTTSTSGFDSATKPPLSGGGNGAVDGFDMPGAQNWNLNNSMNNNINSVNSSQAHSIRSPEAPQWDAGNASPLAADAQLAERRRQQIAEQMARHPDLRRHPLRAPFHRLQTLIVAGASRAALLAEVLACAAASGLLEPGVEQSRPVQVDNAANGALLLFLVHFVFYLYPGGPEQRLREAAGITLGGSSGAQPQHKKSLEFQFELSDLPYHHQALAPHSHSSQHHQHHPVDWQSLIVAYIRHLRRAGNAQPPLSSFQHLQLPLYAGQLPGEPEIVREYAAFLRDLPGVRDRREYLQVAETYFPASVLAVAKSLVQRVMQETDAEAAQANPHHHPMLQHSAQGMDSEEGLFSGAQRKQQRRLLTQRTPGAGARRGHLSFLNDSQVDTSFAAADTSLVNASVYKSSSSAGPGTTTATTGFSGDVVSPADRAKIEALECFDTADLEDLPRLHELLWQTCALLRQFVLQGRRAALKLLHARVARSARAAGLRDPFFLGDSAMNPNNTSSVSSVGSGHKNRGQQQQHGLNNTFASGSRRGSVSLRSSFAGHNETVARAGTGAEDEDELDGGQHSYFLLTQHPFMRFQAQEDLQDDHDDGDFNDDDGDEFNEKSLGLDGSEDSGSDDERVADEGNDQFGRSGKQRSSAEARRLRAELRNLRREFFCWRRYLSTLDWFEAFAESQPAACVAKVLECVGGEHSFLVDYDLAWPLWEQPGTVVASNTKQQQSQQQSQQQQQQSLKRKPQRGRAGSSVFGQQQQESVQGFNNDDDLASASSSSSSGSSSSLSSSASSRQHPWRLIERARRREQEQRRWEARVAGVSAGARGDSAPQFLFTANNKRKQGRGVSSSLKTPAAPSRQLRPLLPSEDPEADRRLKELDELRRRCVPQLVLMGLRVCRRAGLPTEAERLLDALADERLRLYAACEPAQLARALELVRDTLLADRLARERVVVERAARAEPEAWALSQAELAQEWQALEAADRAQDGRMAERKAQRLAEQQHQYQHQHHRAMGMQGRMRDGGDEEMQPQGYGGYGLADGYDGGFGEMQL